MKIQRNLLVVGLSFAVSYSACVSAEPLSLAESPLITAQSVPPNIMVLFDTSGSMQNIVPDSPYDASITYADCPNDRTLDDDDVYTLNVLSNSGIAVIEEDDTDYLWGTAGIADNGYLERCFDSDAVYNATLIESDIAAGTAPYTGNYLNWYFSNSDQSSYAIWDNDANRRPGTKTRNEVGREALVGLIGQADEDDRLQDVRLGLAGFNSGNEEAEFEIKLSDIETARANILAAVNALDASGGTPLASAYASLGNYFTANDDENILHTGIGDTDVCLEYNWRGRCLEWEQGTVNYTARDLFSNVPDYSAVSAPANPNEVIQYSCQKSVVISITDGLPSPGDNTYGDIVAKWQDGTEDAGTDEPGDYDDIVKAMYDLDLRPDYDEDNNNITTYTIGFGLDSEMLNRAARFGVGAAVDDTSITAYRADDLTGLSSALDAIVVKVQSQISSFASVAFNTGRLVTGSSIYQARFNTDGYTGQLLSFKLNPQTGAIRGLDKDSGVERDLAADESIFDIDPIWEAGEELDAYSDGELFDSDNLGYRPRKVFTFSTDPAVLDGVPFTWDSLSDAQKADLAYGADISDTNAYTSAGNAIIDYLLGRRSSEIQNGGPFRNRNSRLGDIVNSSPVFVGKPQLNWPDYDASANIKFGASGSNYSAFKSTNNGRTEVVYVGANDGMLHGFNASNTADAGKEVMAYIPGAVYSSAAEEGLHHLADPDYVHEFYVDLSPTVSDVYLSNAWRTVLVGGLRSGGRGLFALDVTNPNLYADPASNADDVVLWEFNDQAGTGDPDLGYTYAQPTIAMVPYGTTGRWAAIVGNGYNSANENAVLFIIFLDGGLDGEWTDGSVPGDPVDYVKIQATTGTGNSNGLSTPRVVDLNGDLAADRVYAGDLQGNMWVFDISSSSTDSWGLAYDDPLITAVNDDDEVQSITSAPVVAFNPAGEGIAGNSPNLLVMFGTGKFLEPSDAQPQDEEQTQSYYGVWDSGTDNLDRDTQLVERILLTETFTFDGVEKDLRRLEDTEVEVEYDDGDFGWYLDLVDYDGTDLEEEGERVIADSNIRGTVLFFNTLIPDNTACSGGGRGWLMSMDYVTGLGPRKAVFDANNDGLINSGDLDENGLGYVGEEFLEGIPSESGFLNDQYTAGTSGEIEKRDIELGVDMTGRLSWEELFRQ